MFTDDVMKTQVSALGQTRQCFVDEWTVLSEHDGRNMMVLRQGQQSNPAEILFRSRIRGVYTEKYN